MLSECKVISKIKSHTLSCRQQVRPCIFRSSSRVQIRDARRRARRRLTDKCVRGRKVREAKAGNHSACGVFFFGCTRDICEGESLRITQPTDWRRPQIVLRAVIMCAPHITWGVRLRYNMYVPDDLCALIISAIVETHVAGILLVFYLFILDYLYLQSKH